VPAAYVLINQALTMQHPKTVFVKVKYFFMFFELFILFLRLETIVNIKKTFIFRRDLTWHTPGFLKNPGVCQVKSLLNIKLSIINSIVSSLRKKMNNSKNIKKYLTFTKTFFENLIVSA